MTILGKIERLFKFVTLLIIRAYSLYWSAIFSSKSLHIHPSAKILGWSSIRLGSKFSAGRLLWIEAIQSYDGKLLDPHLVIGSGVSVSDCVHIACAGSVAIGDYVLIGSNVHITDHNHGLYSGGSNSSPAVRPVFRKLDIKEVKIFDNVFIGDGVVILPGSVINHGAIVGANSVVSGELMADTIYAGIPARPIKEYCNEKKEWINCK